MGKRRRRHANCAISPASPSPPQTEVQRAAARLRLKSVRQAKLSAIDAGEPTPEQSRRNTYRTVQIKDPDAPAPRLVKRNLSSRNLERWYSAKKIDERQFRAGERYRGDYERTGFAQRVTATYDIVSTGGGSGTHTPAMPGTLAEMDAWRAWRAARETLVGLECGFDAMVLHDQMATEIDVAEDRIGIYTRRTSMMAVKLCLERLAAYYRL